MAFIIADRVREFSTTNGTGNIFLGGAVVGYQSFSDGIGNGNQTFYAISLPGSTAWEVGIGTVQVGILQRNTVLQSSNSDALVNFPTGTKDVFCTYPAQASVYVVNGEVQLPAGAVVPVEAGGTGNTSVEAEVTRLAASPNIAEIATILGAAIKDENNAFTGDNTFVGSSGFAGATFSGSVRMTSTGALKLPSGTTAERPTGEASFMRFNVTTGEFEGYNGTTWASVGGSAISNDTTTATPMYPLFADDTTGTAANVYTADPDYLYTPSTGRLEAPQPYSSSGMFVNANVSSGDRTIAAGENALVVGGFTLEHDWIVEGDLVML